MKMNIKGIGLVLLADCVGPRPEYFIQPVGNTTADGGLACYSTPRPATAVGIETVWVRRVFACNRRRFELLHLATFFLN